MIPGAAFVPGITKPTVLADLHCAIRLGGLCLALATVMVLNQLAIPVAIALLGFALRWTGMVAVEQLRLLKPWWPMATIVLAVHTTTGSLAAGHLVIGGFYSGLTTLGRIILCLGLFSLFLRVTSLEDTINAVHFWFRPLRFIGVQTQHLGLVLAVALGTAPVVLEEGHRIRAVVRMRRAQANPADRPSLFVRLKNNMLEWGHIVLPIMESLGRRADTLSLSLATRMPADSAPGDPWSRPGLGSLLALTLWLIVLLWFVAPAEIRGWV